MLLWFSIAVRSVSVRMAFLFLLIASTSVTTAQAPSDRVAAAYGFGEAAGSTTADASGNGNTATLVNGPTWTSAGRFGRSLTFDGVNDTIQLPATETVALSTGFTFEAWIAPTSFFTSGSRKLWSHPSLALLVTSQGYLYATANLTGGYRAFYSTTTIPLNTWSYVAYTYDGTALRLYINGTAAGTTTVTGTVAATVDPMTLGGPYSDGIAANLDEVRLYRRGLTASEMWLDSETPVDAALPLQISEMVPRPGSVGIVRTSMTITFSRAVNEATVSTGTVELRDSTGATVVATVSYDAATRSATLTPSSALTPLADYTLRVVGGASGVYDTLGAALAGDFQGTFRAASAPSSPSAAFGFGEASGSTAADGSGNGNTAALVNAPTWTSAGQFGTGLSLDGVNDVLQLPVTETLGLTEGFTFETWIAPTNLFTSGARKLWSHPSLALSVTWQGYLYATANLTGGYRAFYSTTTIPVNIWSHVAYTYDGAALRLYINGTVVGTTTVTGTVAATANPMTLGGAYADGIAATLDEVRLYRRGLTASEMWLDSDTPVDATLPLQISEMVPRPGSVGVVRRSMTMTFSRAVNEATVTTSTVELRDSTGATVAATVSYDAATRSATLTPSSALTPLARYTLRVVGGARGVYDTLGTALAGDFQGTFRAASAPSSPSAAFGFSEASGSTAADGSGNGNTAALVNAPTWTSAGQFGTGLSFDGVNNVLQLPLTETLALSEGFTFETWIAPTNLFTSGARKLWSHPSLALSVTWQGYLYATGNLTGGYRAFYSTTTIPVNTWSHVAYTYDGAALRLYINGTAVGTTTVTGTVAAATVNPMTLGGAYADGIAATLDEVRLYQRALNPAEILADKNTAINCTYTLSPSSISAPFGGTSGAVAVTASAGCAWAPTSSASWLTGVAEGSHVNYTVAPNTTTSIRSATISIASQAVVVVTQAAMPSCVHTGTPTDRFERRHRGWNRRHGRDDDDDDDEADCSEWTAANDATWLAAGSPSSISGLGYLQRLLADGVDIRTIQLMLGHADIRETQRYLNITDEELRKAMTGGWERPR
jgi:hypothetical protein